MRHDFGGGDGVRKVMGGKENTKIDGGNKYSDLPNNCAANLIIFWEKKHLHNLIRTYTFINF